MALVETGHSALFSKYMARYVRGGCTKDQLMRLVNLGALTSQEYDEIVASAQKSDDPDA